MPPERARGDLGSRGESRPVVVFEEPESPGAVAQLWPAADPAASLGQRRKSLALTAALASVLFALGAYTLTFAVLTANATNAHRESLALDALFGEARNAIAQEEVSLRHYEVEPSSAVRKRFGEAADAVTVALLEVQASDSPPVRADAQRLLSEQAYYRELGEHLMVLVADRDPEELRFDRINLTPAYYTLQQDIDHVSRSYHAIAEREATQLRVLQTRMLIGTAIGFGIGLALVGMIWRLVLGYQRRLIAHALESQRLAMHDPLTELPNRTAFSRELELGLEDARRDGGREIALMIIDLNGFKAVNDTLGHQAGDELLVAVGKRLREAVRGGDVVARLGGDEFGVLLPEVPDLRTVRSIADRISDVLRRDFRLPAGSAAVSGSVGVVIGRPDMDSDLLVRHADSAMYRAKSAGGGVAIFDPETDAEAPDRMGLFADLRALLETGDPEGQLRLYYQPLVRIADCTTTAVEALVRWQHPERGLLGPAEFLPVAESRGLEIALTYRLLTVATEQAAFWQSAGRPLIVSLNIFPQCLLDQSFVPRIQAATDWTGLAPELLRLEITESSVVTDVELAEAALGDVRELGVAVSIDDYGNGFSSLAQLRRLPTDELKIDRGFIRELVSRNEDQVLVRSTIEMAHDLRLSVVAEGVEDPAALVMLHRLHCDYAQGFLLSRPVPADELPAAVERANRHAREALAAENVAGPRPDQIQAAV